MSLFFKLKYLNSVNIFRSVQNYRYPVPVLDDQNFKGPKQDSLKFMAVKIGKKFIKLKFTAYLLILPLL
jgi:hypothetical protein